MIVHNWINELLNNNATNTYSALSLFSGIGGLCLGVKKAGFDVVGAVEYDKYAAVNYRLNFPDIPLFEGDVAKLMPADDAELFAQQKAIYADVEQLDLLFGGPPCQGYSQIGPRDVADPRNEMYLEVCRLAELLNPKFILIENVPNMLLMKKGMFKDRILSALKDVGYSNIGLKILNGVDFGLPQARKRVFILATKPETLAHSLQDIFDAVAQTQLRPMVSVDDAISDLPAVVSEEPTVPLAYPTCAAPTEYQREMRLDTNGTIFPRAEKRRTYAKVAPIKEIVLFNHHTKQIQEKRLRLIKLLEPGKKANSLPQINRTIWSRHAPIVPEDTLLF